MDIHEYKMKYFMVGDWVYNKHHEKYVRITPYDFFTHGHESDGTQYLSPFATPTIGRDLVPVELTPEILEKNEFYWGNTSDEEDFASNVGCALNEKGWVWDEGGGSVKIIFPNESDGGLIVMSDQSFDRDMTITFVKPIYVHELQHLLKFFHIDKDIVL